ncbi:MAG: hypothetical protein HQL66_00785 [Magnetococcales bacterium]|nr:hypothetical protein [Magnetococcales bacterium]
MNKTNFLVPLPSLTGLEAAEAEPVRDRQLGIARRIGEAFALSEDGASREEISSGLEGQEPVFFGLVLGYASLSEYDRVVAHLAGITSARWWVTTGAKIFPELISSAIRHIRLGELPELEGTEKQAVWAGEIRAQHLDRAERMLRIARIVQSETIFLSMSEQAQAEAYTEIKKIAAGTSLLDQGAHGGDFVTLMRLAGDSGRYEAFYTWLRGRTASGWWLERKVAGMDLIMKDFLRVSSAAQSSFRS